MGQHTRGGSRNYVYTVGSNQPRVASGTVRGASLPLERVGHTLHCVQSSQKGRLLHDETPKPDISEVSVLAANTH